MVERSSVAASPRDGASTAASAPPAIAVSLRNLVKEFTDTRTRSVVRAVDDLSLDIREGEFFALLGPSGCGKTTTLRAIGGFEDPTSGEILLRGEPVQGIPPFHRPVNTVFQAYALFPHMSVVQNVMFGLKMARISRAEARERAEEALAMVQLPQVADRKPAQLSGGQQQRVALARALVNRPAVLLLDEPLGALDLKLRKAMQFELKQLQQQVGITFIYVTHDQEEALTMADRIAVMSDGRVLQVGAPDDIYERPQSRFVADFIGETNFIAGRLRRRGEALSEVELPRGRTMQAVVRDETLRVGGEATVAIRPEKLDITRAGASSPGASTGDAVTRLPGTIVEVHYIGTDTRYHVAIDDGPTVVARIQNQHHGYDALLDVGEAVELTWHSRHASILA